MKNLTEDTTDDFSQNEVAKKLIELVNFYRVHKDSLSQVFLEKSQNDYRLVYFLACIQEIEVILPVLN